MPRDKPRAVSRRMKTDKWSIVALQETHESEAAAAELERANPRIWAYPNPGTTMAKGTMFLVHKDLLPETVSQKQDFTNTVLIPGRAQSLTFKWRNNETMTLVNIYAPNQESEAASFFKTLTRKLRGTNPIIMGDFNHVENEIDRQPQREPNPTIREAMTELRTSLGLVDGWRYDNPGTHAYTWTSLMPTLDVLPRSRLDRILVTPEIRRRSLKWEIHTPQGLSDHSPITVEIIDDQQPEMGPVRWRMTAEELKDPATTKATRECLRACQRKIAAGADALHTWLETKRKIRNIFENVKRAKAKERSATLKNLEADLRKTRTRTEYHTDARVRENAEAVEHRIDEIKSRIANKAAETTTARYGALGETVSKYWFGTGKALQTRTMVRSMKDDTGARRTDSLAILEIMRKHHEQLATTPAMTAERLAEIEKIRWITRGTNLSERSREVLADEYSLREAELAIKVASNGKAPGPDGITYEFYKMWNEKHAEDTAVPKKEPNIAVILHAVWNATAKRENAPAEYSEGLMALAYKKGDKEEAANYRPLTLLNTDLKLETKVLATRMGLTLPEVIHNDQAGFVPGRDILDHVRMAQTVAEYCKVTETNGCLVAMDQEKAYDRIDHEYLWKIMASYSLPKEFIQRIKALYASAQTRVTLNRWISSPFKVGRGVRQGDPMSCLLFDLAIEPLAEMLRQSNLKGIKVPQMATRLVCKLFADDTQI